MSKKSFPIKPSVLISIGLTAGIGLWLYSGVDEFDTANAAETSSKTEQESGNETAAPVISYKSSVRYMLSEAKDHQSMLNITAQTQYDRKATVRAETYGQITKINMEETFAVKKGVKIAQIEIADRGAQIKRAKAILKQRKIQFEAATKLAQKGFNSKIKKSEAEANLEIAQAELSVAEINYGNTTLKSPFSGIVQEQHVEIGDYVQKGDPIATIIDMDPISIIAYVSEKEIAHIQKGSLATATLMSGEKLEGMISHIAPVALETTRSFRVEVELNNSDNHIRSGLTASISLPLGLGKAHLISPALLTLNDAGQVGVKYVDDQGIVHFTTVNIIEDTEKGVWVNGLPARLKIIAIGQEFVSDGAKVIATELTPATIAANS